jgi:hypothetical protein
MAVARRLLTRVILEEVHPFVSSYLEYVGAEGALPFLKETERAFRDQWRRVLFVQWNREAGAVLYEIEGVCAVVMPLLR